ncbi:MAG: type II toxin-antitoxin system death-on-curing family toxin [Janthinobacterium lividum]
MNAANESSIWLTPALVRAIHDEQLVEHGGPAGLRDEGLLSSALNRPRHRALYETPDIADLAASHAFEIARDRPFVDGNKRTAFFALEVFLDLNGWELMADDESCVVATLQLAAGRLEEDVLAKWIRDNLRLLRP